MNGRALGRAALECELLGSLKSRLVILVVSRNVYYKIIRDEIVATLELADLDQICFKSRFSSHDINFCPLVLETKPEIRVKFF